MVVTIETEPSITVGAPEVLFEYIYWSSFTGGRRYDLSPDGERFLMIKPRAPTDDTGTQTQIVVVENWFEELQRLVPVD